MSSFWKVCILFLSFKPSWNVLLSTCPFCDFCEAFVDFYFWLTFFSPSWETSLYSMWDHRLEKDLVHMESTQSSKPERKPQKEVQITYQVILISSRFKTTQSSKRRNPPWWGFSQDIINLKEFNRVLLEKRNIES